MAKIHKQIRIDAPVERVYEFMTQPKYLPEIWPSLVEVSKIKRKPDGHHSFDWVYKMAGMRFKGHAETIALEQNRMVKLRNEKGIPSTFHWVYEDKDGHAQVTLEIEYQLPGKLLGKLAEPLLVRMNEAEAETLLNNLKLRMEAEQEKVA